LCEKKKERELLISRRRGRNEEGEIRKERRSCAVRFFRSRGRRGSPALRSELKKEEEKAALAERREGRVRGVVAGGKDLVYFYRRMKKKGRRGACMRKKSAQRKKKRAGPCIRSVKTKGKAFLSGGKRDGFGSSQRGERRLRKVS